MDPAVIDVLRDIGLTEYQSRAYVAIVTLGTARISTLSDEAGIPQQRIYDVVDDLEGLSLVEVHEGASGKEAVAIPPEIGLAELQQQRMDRFKSNVDAAIDDLTDRFSQVNTSMGFVTVVNHRSSVNRHIRNAIESADWWLFLSLPVDWYHDFQTEIQAAIEDGVTARLLIQSDDPSSVRDLPYVAGLLVRHRASADIVVAADRDYAVFRGVASPSVARPSLVTRDENIVEMFQRYSEQFWSASRRVRTDHPYPRRYLEPWRAINDHAGLLDADEPLSVYIEGHDTDSGRVGSWEGTILEYRIETGYDTDYSVVIPEIAQLAVDTADGRRTVGGWDATLEDIAAHGLEIRRQ